MPSKNCTKSGGTDEERFGEPMLWIGLYVAAASIVCSAAIGADIIRSWRWSKQWVSPKFFVLNAAVLTILGVATKIPSDVNGAMPGLLDQLAKLTGILLICVAMSHAMPSLGVMNNWELLSNMVALGILVISTAVNIWFQIHSTLITTYASANIMFTIIMLFMFSILVSHSLSVATIKQHLEKKYRLMQKKILSGVDRRFQISGEELEGYVKKYWLMALTSSPDFVLLTSGMSAACGNLYWTLFGSFVGSLSTSGLNGRRGCYINSDYKWSAGLIPSVQVLAIIGGVVSALLRLSNARIDDAHLLSFKRLLYVEKYRMQQLRMWKKNPLPFHVRNETLRKVAYHAKNLGVNILILFQRVVTFLTRLQYLIVSYIGFIVLLPISLFCLLIKKETPASPPPPSSQEDLSSYVLCLEGESENEQKKIAQQWKDYPDRWFEIGRARKPRGLLKLIDKFSEGNSRVLRTTSIRHFRTETFEVLEYSWSLHLATLMCIIHAVFYGTPQEGDNVESLMKALDEGFLYFMLVDANKDKPSNEKALDAAKMVWQNLQFGREWLDVRLERVADRKDFSETLGDLQRLAKEHAEKYEKEDLPDYLSSEALAAKSMSRIAGALLNFYDGSFSFEKLEAETAGVVETCLADLPVAILRECSNGSYGYREKHVRLAAQVFGETEDIRKSLEARRRASGF